jgi:alkanesulfonate monooxygenase SsuD/methylene tetrahydromethanopterin reductase-like flavin-dependent oxidoreductase (luciferase family)
MDFSFWPTTAQPWPDLLRGCTWAEANGWHGIWVPDHFMTNVPVGADPDGDDGRAELAPWLEAWTTQAALAALVPRVRIGAMVTGNLYRHPAVVANMAGTIDEISGGRCVIGLGAGWQANEHARYGIELTGPADRSDRLEEACLVIRSLLDEPRTSVGGDHYVLDGAPCEPSGHAGHRIPLLVGGKGEQRTLRTVARHADEWNVWATPDEVAPKRRVIERWCDEIDRDPAEIRITIAAMVAFCDGPADRDRVRARLGNHGGLVGADVDEVRAAVDAYAAAGVDELVIADFNLGRDRREDVLGRLQAEVIDALG